MGKLARDLIRNRTRYPLLDATPLVHQIVLDKVGNRVDQFRILKGLVCKSKDTGVLSSADLLIE